MDAFEKINFIQRLKSLQRLCSDSDSGYPKALLFVNGQDGRYNKGSISVFKYLFWGAVSKDLFDESFYKSPDSIEEIVLLVKENSCSIFWSHDVKDSLSPNIFHASELVEYLTSSFEENDIDNFQAKKCTDFKRMILDALRYGDGIGIPIPIGYEDINEIETWPIIQAFASDEVYCPTGFFTSLYKVADITPNLEVLFKSIDGYCVGSSIKMLQDVAIPHMNQCISMLETVTAEQRTRLTAEDIIGPLEILFDYGEMESHIQIDPALKPIVLIGTESLQLGSNLINANKTWRQKKIGLSSHIVIQGIEPTTGLRWCRTYFLHSGKTLTVNIKESLYDIDEIGELNSGLDKVINSKFLPVSNSITSALKRMEKIYIKLWSSFRFVIKVLFGICQSIERFGIIFKKIMHNIMQGLKVESISDLDIDTALFEPLYSMINISLTNGESLKIHIDCMNSFGEIISADDVEDLGGTCWAYIRLEVHGIDFEMEKNSLAVGDTFLFSPTPIMENEVILSRKKLFTSPIVTISDCYCITHQIPYFKALVGPGAEDKSVQRLSSLSRSSNMLPFLGIGNPIEYSSALIQTINMLSSHPLYASFQANARFYSEGLIVEKIDGHSILPILISFQHHVKSVYAISIDDIINKVKDILPLNLTSIIDIPDGIVWAFELNPSQEGFVESSQCQVLETNPLDSSLPYISHISKEWPVMKKFICVVLESDNSTFFMSKILPQWRNGLRLHGIEEFRGGRLPQEIIDPFLQYIDQSCNHRYASTRNDGRLGPLIKSSKEDINIDGFLKIFEFSKKIPNLEFPGLGLLATNCLAAVSLSCSADVFDYIKANPSPDSLIVFCGLPGSGIVYSTAQYHQQIAQRFKSKTCVESIELDLTMISIDDTDFIQFIRSSVLNRKKLNAPTDWQNTLFIASIVLTNTIEFQVSQVMQALEIFTHSKLRSVIGLISPSTLNFGFNKSSVTRYSNVKLSDSKFGLGYEKWNAKGKEVMQESISDLIIALDEKSSSTSYSDFKSHLDLLSPNMKLFRVTPINMRLSEDDLDLIMLSLSPNKLGLPTNRELNYLFESINDSPVVTEDDLEKIHFKYLASLDINICAKSFFIGSNSIEIDFWDISFLLTSISNLFPSAPTNNISIEESWYIPSPDPKFNPHKRLLQLAHSKTAASLQKDQGNSIFNRNLKKFISDKKESFMHIVESIWSIHGEVYIENGIVPEQGHFNLNKCPDLVSIECSRSGILTKLSNRLSSKNISYLIIHGSFSDDDKVILNEYFKLSKKHRLERKVLISLEDLTRDDKREIQHNPLYQNIPLPDGWWYDGYFFIDINGTRRDLRPDIDTIAGYYLEKVNKEIIRYNNLVFEKKK